MILKEYVEEFLKESLKISDIPKIDMIIEKLNEESLELLNKLTERGDEEDYDHYIFGYLDNVAYKNEPRLEEIGEGEFRRVYNIPGEEWVLKLSMSKSGAKINKKEIEISQGKHGLSARDIFLKIYDYDKISDLPCWIICQKVIPMTDIEDLSILKKVFPTFWNIIKYDDDVHKTVGFHFINMICATLMMFAIYVNDDDPKKAFYEAAEATCDLHDFSEVVFYDDFKRISTAYAYVMSTDMKAENFGLVSLENPSPDSIVILDFDID